MGLFKTAWSRGDEAKGLLQKLLTECNSGYLSSAKRKVKPLSFSYSQLVEERTLSPNSVIVLFNPYEQYTGFGGMAPRDNFGKDWSGIIRQDIMELLPQRMKSEHIENSQYAVIFNNFQIHVGSYGSNSIASAYQLYCLVIAFDRKRKKILTCQQFGGGSPPNQISAKNPYYHVEGGHPPQKDVMKCFLDFVDKCVTRK